MGYILSSHAQTLSPETVRMELVMALTNEFIVVPQVKLECKSTSRTTNPVLNAFSQKRSCNLRIGDPKGCPCYVLIHPKLRIAIDLKLELSRVLRVILRPHFVQPAPTLFVPKSRRCNQTSMYV